MRLPRQSGEHWSFREDGPQGYIELKAHQHSVVLYFAKTPDLEELSTKTVNITIGGGPPKEGPGSFLMFPPRCLESRGCQFDPTFLYLSSCSSANSPAALFMYVLSFSAFGPFFSPLFPSTSFSRKVCSFVWLLVFFFVRAVRR